MKAKSKKPKKKRIPYVSIVGVTALIALIILGIINKTPSAPVEASLITTSAHIVADMHGSVKNLFIKVPVIEASDESIIIESNKTDNNTSNVDEDDSDELDGWFNADDFEVDSSLSGEETRTKDGIFYHAPDAKFTGSITNSVTGKKTAVVGSVK